MAELNWREHWQSRTDGGHRSQTEAFLGQEAAEKLFHLGSGESLLDFGCGSADLLVYYSQFFKRTVGVDFSRAMLDAARERIKTFSGAGTISLVEADDTSVWDKIDGSFDRITAGQVIQYLNRDKIDRFLSHAAGRLNTNGKIVLFDVIDPRLLVLFELGVLGAGRINRLELVKRGLLRALFRWTQHRKGLPPSTLGHAHRPDEIAALSARHGLDSVVVWSMYYEYRYHVILSRRPAGEPVSRPDTGT